MGTTSIGWALVTESENSNEKSDILGLGVRVNPLTTDEKQKFEKGKTITTNADRTLKRSMRRNLQRYKLRRDILIEILKKNQIISEQTDLFEKGNTTTFQTYKSRALAAESVIPLEDFAKVLLMINKKRGYKSSRKSKNADEGQLIDGMEVARRMYEQELTPGQLVLQLLEEGKRFIPDFYRSDLIAEFDKVWLMQSVYYPDILTADLRKSILGKNKKFVAAFFENNLKIDFPEIKGDFFEKKKQRYILRSRGVREKIEIGEMAEALTEIAGDIASSSNYLGAISDRSKELFFKKQTVGQYLWNIINSNSHSRIKGLVFYRQDYLDEFEKIWAVQACAYPQLTDELKSEIRDTIIFYQRRLKSQKGLVSFCEFESKPIEVVVDGKRKKKRIGLRVCPRSSPLFQEFKIWQTINNLVVVDNDSNEEFKLDEDQKELLFRELTFRDKLKKKDILKLLYKRVAGLDLNFDEIDGNRTMTALFNSFSRIVEASGHEPLNIAKDGVDQCVNIIDQVFDILGIQKGLLTFDSSLDGLAYEVQPLFNLWHLLYSYEDDKSNTGIEKLKASLCKKFSFPPEYAAIVASASFPKDYGNLSSKAIRRILPYMRAGHRYDEACKLAGYNHSSSLTREEQENRRLEDRLEVLPKNSLRNPVVEKILNQMVNVVNEIQVQLLNGHKPDEIRIELSRELKKSAEERRAMTEGIARANEEHEKFRKILKSEFGLLFVSKNDIIRYKLYKELEYRGFKTLYSNTYIPAEKLFTKEVDIEHIIPKSRLFDDSFSNKTLEIRSVNIEKGDDTAHDYVLRKYGEDGLNQYISAVNEFYEHHQGKVKAKKNKLLMSGAEIPVGFIDRELRDSQYIAKKAKEMLEKVFKRVNTSTGSITARLREDWQLVDVMQEINWEKYDKLGLTKIEINKNGNRVRKIKDWTKRNDHRHHAMDALTVAFTKPEHVRYLNNLNARSDKNGDIYAIQQRELFKDENGKLRFNSPIPESEFRAKAKYHLERILVSHKAKNKVVTKNTNRIKTKNGYKNKEELTPRGQLHNESVYGRILQYGTREIKIGSNLDETVIAKVSVLAQREALMQRLQEFGNDPKKAFSGKNAPDKNPVFLDAAKTKPLPDKVKIMEQEYVYTIRKEVNPELNVEKVIDGRIREILLKRLNEYDNDPKRAFSNLDEKPIWQNEEKGIKIKRVSITGVSNAVAIHSGKRRTKVLEPLDFVSTGSNHHAAIYRDENGDLQDSVVSFLEAVTRVNQKMDVVDKALNRNLGWQFIFTLKQNECFVFPNEQTGFNPLETDLLDPENYISISPNLFRVQAISKVQYGHAVIREYVFRHHVEAELSKAKELKGVAYKYIKSLPPLAEIVKVRINHIGRIVSVGEY